MRQKGGAFPYGSHPAKPDEKAVLELMVALKNQGVTLTEIAMDLNRQAVPPRRGQCWHVTAVARILQRQSVSRETQ